MDLTTAQVSEFRDGVLGHYRREGRDFPWRRTFDPWLILVSEMMLQQTRTETVLSKWPFWAQRFPTPDSLASSALSEVLTLWKGLGYNRRALALRNAACEIVQDFRGVVPRAEADLRSLPGVGPYTARAVRAFAFGEPDIVIETNIRAVFLFTFFPGRDAVKDREIEPYVAATLTPEDPRTWYYALMDYGAALKRREPNPGRRSASYSRQSPFEGSHRQVRATILHVLAAAQAPMTAETLRAATVSALAKDGDTARDGFRTFERAVKELDAEGFLEISGGVVGLKN